MTQYPSQYELIERECADIVTFLRAFPGRIFEQHSIQKGLDVGISLFHRKKLEAAGVEIIPGTQPLLYRWPEAKEPSDAI